MAANEERQEPKQVEQHGNHRVEIFSVFEPTDQAFGCRRSTGEGQETSAQAAARKHGLTVAEIEEWRERFLLGAENALRARPKDEDALKDEHIKKLKQKIGELVLDLDILKEATKDRPFPPRMSDE
jgi:transposase-like protein